MLLCLLIGPPKSHWREHSWFVSPYGTCPFQSCGTMKGHLLAGLQKLPALRSFLRVRIFDQSLSRI